MGLLGDSLTDPQSQAVFQLAAGLLSPGSFGQGLSKGLTGYQQTLANAQEMQQRQQAMQMQNLQLQQQKRMFELQTPFLEEALRRMQGQSSPADQTPNATVALGQGAQQGSVGPTVANAQRMDAMPSQGAPQQGSTMFPGIPDNLAFATIGTGGLQKIPDLLSKFNEPTPEMKNLAAAYGVNSPQYQAALQQVAQKAGYIAPVNARPGAILRDPLTMKPMAYNPHIPEGGTPVFDASGNVVGINSLPGAAGVIGEVERAKAGGKAAYVPYAGYTGEGRPAPVTSLANVLGTGATTITPDAQIAAMKEALPLMLRERDAMPPGPDRDALTREINRNQNAILTGKPFTASTTASAAPAIYAAPPLGAEKSANNAQDTMTQSYREVMRANQPAQTVQARLDNISQLANAAITGGDTQWRDYANNLLSIAGVSDKASDRKTAGDLIDKNAAQISLAIGSGSQGTDALRTLAAAANPNRHMTPAAIQEAVDQLKASAQMQQAKAALLTPHYNAGNPTNYNNAEQVFDKNADYRLWQLKGMNTQQAQAFLSGLPKNVQAELRAKAQALKGMGAL